MAQAVIAAAHQTNGRKTRYRTQSCFFVLISASQILFSCVAFLLDVPVLLSYERNPLPVSLRDFISSSEYTLNSAFTSGGISVLINKCSNLSQL